MFKLPTNAPGAYNKQLFAHLSLLGAGIIWAATGPIIKLTLKEIDPINFLFFRFLIAGIVLLPYVWFETLKNKINPKDYLNLFLLGVMSQTTLLLVFYALKYTTALDTAIIGVLGSILSVYAGHYFFNDRVDKKLTIGLILASIGTIVVMLEPILQSLTFKGAVMERVFGNFLAILYNITWAVYIIWSKATMGENSLVLKRTLKCIDIKPMKRHYSPPLLVALTIYGGIITLLPLAIIQGLAIPFDIFSLNAQGVFGLLYMAIGSSVIAYTLNQWGLNNATVSDVAMYGYLTPILTLPFAYFLTQEIPTHFMLVGSIFIAVGVIIAEKRNS